MPTILITGFEPFDGDTINPSLEAIRLLGSYRTNGMCLRTAVLPVSIGRIEARLREVLAKHRPDAVIAVGQANTRVDISVERVAINNRRLPGSR